MNKLGAPVDFSIPAQLPGHEPVSARMGYEDGDSSPICGIDVSKDRLDVVVLPEGRFFSVSNDTAGWAELVARLRPLAVSAIGLEPSGGYERGIIRALLAAGLSVRRINPNKLRQFARARGVLAKNHRLDARLIAEYVAIMPTRVVQRMSCSRSPPPGQQAPALIISSAASKSSRGTGTRKTALLIPSSWTATRIGPNQSNLREVNSVKGSYNQSYCG